jgi:septal ring factor EnvC (AmiA/AmiB activator)
MKNEERIIELLVEHLQKTDRILDRLDSHDGLFEEMLKRIDITQQQTQELQNQTKELQKETKDLRSESLKHEIRNDVLLKEILSISKRVMTLEEKNNFFG